MLKWCKAGGGEGEGEGEGKCRGEKEQANDHIFISKHFSWRNWKEIKANPKQNEQRERWRKTTTTTTTKKTHTLRAGFEPAREDPIGFQVQRLNHSAIAAGCISYKTSEIKV